MLNKPLTLGLVAAAMLITPTVALAGDQEQYNEQNTYQNGAAIDDSTNVQNAESYNSQVQVDKDTRYYRDNNRRPRYYKYRDRDRDGYRYRDYDDDYHYRGRYYDDH